MSNTYYDILNISFDASLDEIKSSYRKLAKQYHPDINPNNGDKFKLITTAYDVLKDDNKRNIYNESLKKNIYHVRKNKNITTYNIQTQEDFYNLPDDDKKKPEILEQVILKNILPFDGLTDEEKINLPFYLYNQYTNTIKINEDSRPDYIIIIQSFILTNLYSILNISIALTISYLAFRYVPLFLKGLFR